MKSFELAVNIERVIRSLKNTWTIIKLGMEGHDAACLLPWGEGEEEGRRVGGTRMASEIEAREMVARRG